MPARARRGAGTEAAAAPSLRGMTGPLTSPRHHRRTAPTTNAAAPRTSPAERTAPAPAAKTASARTHCTTTGASAPPCAGSPPPVLAVAVPASDLLHAVAPAPAPRSVPDTPAVPGISATPASPRLRHPSSAQQKLKTGHHTRLEAPPRCAACGRTPLHAASRHTPDSPCSGLPSRSPDPPPANPDGTLRRAVTCATKEPPPLRFSTEKEAPSGLLCKHLEGFFFSQPLPRPDSPVNHLEIRARAQPAHCRWRAPRRVVGQDPYSATRPDLRRTNVPVSHPAAAATT